MVDVAVAATTLAINVASTDLVGSGTAITTGQTFSIATQNDSFRYMVVLEETGSTTGTIVWDAGDNPPSLRAGLGTITTTFAANDLFVMVFEGGRFIKSGTGGLITATATGTFKVRLLLIPLHGLE